MCTICRPGPGPASYDRRLVRLGAQLCAANGWVTEGDHARAWPPSPIGPSEMRKVPIEVPLPNARGRYQLKLDLVAEGIDWFEA